MDNNDAFETGTAICDACGETKKVCCGEFEPTTEDNWMDMGPMKYSEATCVECCRSVYGAHVETRYSDDYCRTDCDV